MSVLEHCFREEAAWDCGQPRSGHFINSTPNSKNPSTNGLIPDQWKKFPESRLLEKEGVGMSNRSKTLLSAGELNHKTTLWSVWTESIDSCQTKGFTCTGKQWDTGKVFPNPSPSQGAKYRAPSQQSAHVHGCPQRCCWHLWFLLSNAKKKKRNIALKLSHTTSLDVFQRVFFCLFPGACLLIYVCLFTLGKGLILKEYIITQNNRPQRAGTAGVIGSEMQSSKMLQCQCS